MRTKIKQTIAETVNDLIYNNIDTSFTKKELKELGIQIPKIKMSANDIQQIRAKTKLNQNVFAKVLNVSSSSVKQWEQGKRIPTGSTKVLLELLRENPEILNYRISLTEKRA